MPPPGFPASQLLLACGGPAQLDVGSSAPSPSVATARLKMAEPAELSHFEPS